MSDLLTVTKRLRPVMARKATLEEAQNNNVRFDKYYRQVKSRPIKLIPGYFYIPNHLEPVFNTGQRGFIGYQYDFAFDASFYILNADSLVNEFTQIFTNNADVCVRYRVGTKVYRYHLGSFYKPLAQSFLFAPQYNGEVIGKNFVIEVWVQYDISVFNYFGTFNNDPNGTKIYTSFLFEPLDANETERRMDDGYFVRDELFVDFDPEAIPTDYSGTGASISNPLCGALLVITGATITAGILDITWSDPGLHTVGTILEVYVSVDGGDYYKTGGEFFVVDGFVEIDTGVIPVSSLLVKLRIIPSSGISCAFTAPFNATIV